MVAATLAEAMAAAAVDTAVTTTSTSTAATGTMTTVTTATAADTYNNQLIAEAQEMAEAATVTAMAMKTTIN